MSGLLTHIQRTDWDLFVTCTYRNSRTMSEKIRRGMQFEFLRRLAEMGGGRRKSSFSELLWVIREEFGEVTNRLHWHCLLSGLPKGIISENTCLFMMGFWEGIGGGMSRIRVYNAEADGASYITKGLEARDWTTQGANGYEVGKFRNYQSEESLMLIPSASLTSQWKAATFKSGGFSLPHSSKAHPGPKQHRSVGV